MNVNAKPVKRARFLLTLLATAAAAHALTLSLLV